MNDVTRCDQYYAEHREQILEKRKLYYAQHRKQIQDNSKRYQDAHPDKIHEWRERWRRTHRAKTHEIFKRWYLKTRTGHPDQLRKRGKCQAARDRKNLTDNYIKSELQKLTSLDRNDIPQWMIEAKRLAMAAKRKMKQEGDQSYGA